MTKYTAQDAVDLLARLPAPIIHLPGSLPWCVLCSGYDDDDEDAGHADHQVPGGFAHRQECPYLIAVRLSAPPVVERLKAKNKVGRGLVVR